MRFNIKTAIVVLLHLLSLFLTTMTAGWYLKEQRMEMMESMVLAMCAMSVTMCASFLYMLNKHHSRS